MIDSMINSYIYWLLDAPDWQLWTAIYVSLVILITLIRSIFKKKPVKYKIAVDSNKLNDVDLSYIKVNKDMLDERTEQRSEERSTNNNHQIEDYESDQSSKRIDGFEPAGV